MNCLVVEQSRGAGLQRVLIDCGVSFPFDDYGVDCCHPRLDYLFGQIDALAGVVFTHGHEDHIGALPELLAAVGGRPLDAWGPPYALELCRRKLQERGLQGRARMHPVDAGERFEVGGFGFEAVRVTHSIPDALAFSIDTPAGRIVHSGDFKLDRAAAADTMTDERRLAELGEEGVALLLSDSTNSLSAGSSGSEAQVAEALDRHVGEARQRAVVALFASNVTRLRAIGAVAQNHGRRLCLLGRSARTHAEVGRQLGLLQWPSDLLVAPALAATLPRRRVLLAVTGTQAEPRAALRRLASGHHPELKLAPGDLVLLSSRIIPGCERAVIRMINDLCQLGVEVRTRATHPELHVSGHAHQAEQLRLLELLSPAAFVPVHGTNLMMEQHAALARDAGVDVVLTLKDGDAVELSAEGLQRGQRVPVGVVLTSSGMPIDDEIIRQRRQLGRGGVLFVAVAGVQASARAGGIPRADEVEEVAERVAQRILVARRDSDDVEVTLERVRRAVRAEVGGMLGYRPIVEVVSA